jgi:O-antigen/teichoic acid export membrane protein
MSDTARRKLVRRLATVAGSSANNLLLPVFNVAISALVIRLASPELWGAFVSVLIVAQLGAHIAAWGNREYLLREFSRRPSAIAEAWQTSLTTRAGLFGLLCLVLIFFDYSAQRALLVMLWGAALTLAQSFDVLVIYRRAFLYALLVEAVTALVIVAAVIGIGSAITVDRLILLFAAAQVVKFAALFIRFRDVLRGFHPRFDPRFIILAAPFFLLGLSGLLASRIDLYAVSYFLPERSVAEYQVFINLMLYPQAAANFIVLPYVRGIYRLDDGAIGKIIRRLFLLGLLLLIPALPGAYWLLSGLYGIHYPALFMLLGGAFVLPVYGYVLLVYRLHKHNRQTVVLKVSLFGAGANLILNIILLPQIGAIGAILASAVIQWGILAFYLVEYRTSQIQTKRAAQPLHRPSDR